MELTQYIRLFRKWAWFIVLIAFVTGGISFIVRSGQPSVYQAQTTITIGSFIQSPNPDSSQIQTGVELAQTYAELTKTYTILQGAADALHLTLTGDQLLNLISVRIVDGTSLLVISVAYTDPVLAADIANEVARQLVQNSPTNLTQDQQNQIDLANSQIDALNKQLEQSRLQLESIDSQVSQTQDQAEISRLTSERNTIIDQINQASATIAEFTNTIAALRQRTNSLDIVEQARIPTAPSGTSVVDTTLISALIGATLAGGIVLLIEYLDDTIRTTEQAAQALALPVLGAIVRFGKLNDSYSARLITNQPSLSPAAESYRTLRTNLLFTTQARKGVYLITSPSPEEGKSITAANLAVTMAQAGLQVLLIDADLRRPRIHEIFGLENKVGLTSLLFADPSNEVPPENGQPAMPANLKHCLQESGIPKLRIITSGFIPSNPTEILGSVLMQRWIDTFRESSNIDIVLIDTPPCLVVADSSVLAATAKADVIVVLDCGRTHRSAALKAKDQFLQVSVTVKGVVVNRVNPADEGYGYGYYYYYQPIGSTASKNGRGWRKIFSRSREQTR